MKKAVQLEQHLPIDTIGHIDLQPITREMETSYLNYAMSVIVSRALPDVRDGLKPVHRRILYSMWQTGLRAGAKYRKCATVVGDVLGKYHPHGDSAVYDSLVRMAQDFSLRYPLVNGQGNFGCFTKETKVRLTDGREASFETLLNEHAAGKKNFTYTVNAKGLIAVAEILHPRLTRKNAELVKVVLDNGEEIRCTPNHRFMLRDGSYCEAVFLTKGVSLMPLYTRLSEKADRLNREGYLLILQNATGEWKPAHHLSDNYNLSQDVYQKSAGRVRHHVDFNKLNNDPSNIRRMSWGEHWQTNSTGKRKFLAISKVALADCSILNAETYGLCRLRVYPYGLAPLWETGIHKYFQGNAELVLQTLNGNHKVVRVERLTQREDVYDLTVDGTHNFCLASGVFVHNSLDGDSAAAYRYTESKLTSIAEEMLLDIEKDTVGFMPNFDGTHNEPRVLPAKLPNLLLNGTLGIAVGMATNIPPHNLSELCEAIGALIENPEISVMDLMQYVKGPDFPTGGIVYGVKDLQQAYATGKGSIDVRAKTEIVEGKSGWQIIVHEIPYQVNKATLLEKIAELVQEKKIEGIRDLRDESNREGVRIVVELKKDAYPKKVLNRLFQMTSLQQAFHFNMLALIDGIQPRVLSLKNLLDEYVKHREGVVRRRTQYDLDRAKDRAHILEGLRLALLKIDEIIRTIKKSKDKDEARVNLIKGFKLSDLQAGAILEMRLQQLANLERLKVEQEYEEKMKLIKELEAILKSEKRVSTIVKDEVLEIKKRFGDERRTEIIKAAIGEFKMEDVIADAPTIVLMSRDGYIKRLPPDTFRTQTRGGKGVSGLTTKEEDIVEQVFSTTTHKDLMFFTSRGRVFQLKAYDVPEASRTAKGQALVNFLQLGPGEKVSASLSLDDLSAMKYLVMVTNKGTIKKSSLADFANVRRSGLLAIKLKDGDNLEWVKPTSGNDDVVLVTGNGQSIRFSEKDARPMGRVASGVRGIRMKGSDEVVGMDVLPGRTKEGEYQLLVVMQNGFGKRTDVTEYKTQGRGGSGIKTAAVTNKTGKVVSAFVVGGKDTRDLFCVSEGGQVIRTALSSISEVGRATQGVRVMRFKQENDKVSSVAIV